MSSSQNMSCCSETDLEVPTVGLSGLRMIIRFDNIFKLNLIKPSQHALTWPKNGDHPLHHQILLTNVCWLQITHYTFYDGFSLSFSLRKFVSTRQKDIVSMILKKILKFWSDFIFVCVSHAPLRAEYISLEVYVKLNQMFSF